MDQRERYQDDAETMRLALEALQTRIWTSLPCLVQAFPSASGLGPMILDAQPMIAGSYLNAQGETIVLQMPLLINVPVQFPGGGGVTLTFPIKPGDECLVTFTARCLDAWWQLGAGTAPNPGHVPPDERMHNLSDGVAYVGIRSNPRAQSSVFKGLDPLVAQLVSDDGTTCVQLNPQAQVVNITAPGGITLNTVTIDKNGNLTSPATIQGKVVVESQTNVHLGTHTHSGVSTGGSNTLKPVAGS